MSQLEQAAGNGVHNRGMGCVLSAIGLVFLFFLMASGILMGLLELVWNLLFGWIVFISRVIPRISWDWGAIFTGILFAGVVGILAHHFLVWLTRGIAVARGISFQWQWRWTACGLVLCGFCLPVGMSVAGAAHQIGWILGRKESLYEDRYWGYRFYEVKMMEIAIKQALGDENTLPELRKSVQAQLAQWQPSRRLPSLESVRLLVSMTPSNRVHGVLVISRDRTLEARYSAQYVTVNDSSPILQKDLPHFIQLNATNLIAF